MRLTAVIALTLALGTAAAAEAGMPILRVAVSAAEVVQGGSETLTASQAGRGAACHATVSNLQGARRSLGSRTASSSGVATWTFAMSTADAPGRWYLTATCAQTSGAIAFTLKAASRPRPPHGR